MTQIPGDIPGNRQDEFENPLRPMVDTKRSINFALTTDNSRNDGFTKLVQLTSSVKAFIGATAGFLRQIVAVSILDDF